MTNIVKVDLSRYARVLTDLAQMGGGRIEARDAAEAFDALARERVTKAELEVSITPDFSEQLCIELRIEWTDEDGDEHGANFTHTDAADFIGYEEERRGLLTEIRRGLKQVAREAVDLFIA